LEEQIQQVHWAVNYEYLALKSAYIVLLISSISYLIYWVFNSRAMKTVGTIMFIAGAICLTATIAFRVIHSGRFPFIRSYEVFLTLGWMMLLVALYADKLSKNVFAKTFVSFFVAVSMIYIEGFTDPSTDVVTPALQSHWLEFHVATTMFGYAAFSVGFLAAEAYLVSRLDWLEELSYKMSALGFPFLTVGIVSGAVWAQEAWGTWWGWDPKETASLIMWLVYAAYLHMRLSRGWHGAKAAWMNLAGFFSMLFCFMGLNWVAQYFELNSEHVYSGGSQSVDRMAYFVYMVLAIAVVVYIGGTIMKLANARKSKTQEKSGNDK
jgi:ABC-type transport system involved in cytochrome c biogenesis permease subunit